MEPRVVITLQEAATQLGVHVATVYRLIHEGELDAYKVGRASRMFQDSIISFQERNKMQPKNSDGNPFGR